MRRLVLLLLLVPVFATAQQWSEPQPFETQRIVPRNSQLDTTGLTPQIDHSFVKNLIPPENPEVKLPGGAISKNTFPPTISPIKPLNFGNYPVEGKSTTYPGVVDLGWLPPDTSMAVGPAHIVMVVNSKIAFYAKSTGAEQFNQTFDTFFAAEEQSSSSPFDPKVIYDKIAGRFFVIALDGANTATCSNILLAVSDDNNPNGTWHKYRIDARVASISTNWLDYPGFGYNKDAIIVTGNQFYVGGGSPGCQIIVIRKTQALTGAPLVVNSHYDTNLDTWTIQPCEMFDASLAKIYGVNWAYGDHTKMMAWTFANLTTTPTYSNAFVTIPTFTSPLDAESTNNYYLDALDGRLINAVYRPGKLVTSHTINGSPRNAKVRWYEFNVNATTNAFTLSQSGDLGYADADTHMPAIGRNAAGDTAVVFSRSSDKIAADIMFSMRKTTDPVNTMATPKVLSSSPRDRWTRSRWGDYAAVCVDPSSDSTFWVATMVIAGDDPYQGPPNAWWATRFHKVVVGAAEPALNTLTSASTMRGGTTIPGTVTLASAPTTTVAVLLSSDNAALTVPTSASFDPGQTSSTFDIGSLGVDANVVATLTATLGAVTKTKAITVQPAILDSVSLVQSPVAANTATTLNINLLGKNGPTNRSVTITSNKPVAIPTSPVTLFAQVSTTTAKVDTGDTTTSQTAVLTATLSGVSKTASLNVIPGPSLSSLVVPSQVKAQHQTTGTVNIVSAAPAGGSTVTLSTSSPNLYILSPLKVVIPAGSTSATFIFNTKGTSTSNTQTITATKNGVSKPKNVLILPYANISTFVINPNVIPCGQNVGVGTVTLSEAGDGVTVTVNVTTNTSLLTVPPTANTGFSNTITFNVVSTASPITTTAVRTVTVERFGRSITRSVSITPSLPTNLALNPASVKGGNPSTGTVTLNGRAPTGGTVITTVSNSSLVVVGPNVTVPYYATTANFTINTLPVSVNATRTVSAKRLGVTITRNITLTP